MKSPIITDKELCESLYRQDRSAFNAIYEKYWKRLFLYAFRILGDKETCEDIIQEVFVNLWQRSAVIKIDTLEAYLIKAIRYQISNHIRSKKDTAKIDQVLDQLIEQTSAESVLEKAETERIINQSVKDLPVKRREIFLLSREEQLSNKEIAYQLDISVRTVESHIYKALKHIRRNLGEVYIWIGLFFSM